MHPTDPSEKDPDRNIHQHSTPPASERLDEPSPDGVPHRNPRRTRPQLACNRTRPEFEQFPCPLAHHPGPAGVTISLPDADTASCPLGSGCPTLQSAAPFPSPSFPNRETDHTPRPPDVVVPDGSPALTPGLAAVLLRLLRRRIDAQPSPDNTVYEHPPHDDKKTERKAS